MNINVVGLGYIGLPTALMMASNGIDVVGVDKNFSIVETLNRDEMTFEEEGLQELFASAQKKGIRFSNFPVKADIYIVAVPTPFDKFTKKIDASYVVNAVTDVLSVCSDEAIIVIESTVSPGTIDRYVRPLIGKKNIHIAHAPERIIPGRMIYELEHNSRTIGIDDKSVGEKLKALYSSFCKGEIVVTDIRSAEMVKIVENTYRDINIAFANELAKICRQGNMDVYEVIRIANMHPRVNILQPGPGVGGHCISVDPWFLVGDYPQLSLLIHEARKINDSMPEYVLARTTEIMEKTGVSDFSRIGFYGLTYKENVDDIRESPTLQLLEAMKMHLAPMPKVYDPYIKKPTVINQFYNLDEFLNSIDMVVIMVAHDEIIREQEKLANKIVFDTRKTAINQKRYAL